MTLIQATKIIGLKVITLQGGKEIDTVKDNVEEFEVSGGLISDLKTGSNDDVIASTGDMMTREILDIAEQKWAI